MQSKIRLGILGLGLAMTLALAERGEAGSSKKNKAYVSFHVETGGYGSNKQMFKLGVEGVKRTFSRTPEISALDIASFQVFPAENPAQQYGVVFTLKKGAATRRLQASTNTNVGRWMAAQINGRFVDAVKIDREIDDGKIVIWRNVSLSDIKILDKKLPRTGEKKEKKKKFSFWKRTIT